MDEFFLIAEIKAIYNKNGFFSIVSYSDTPERFLKLRKIYIDVFGDMKEFFVEKVINKNNFLAVKLKNFNTDKEVEFLLGKRIYVDNENLVKLSDNTYFIHDLIGSRVFRNGSQIGTLIDVLTLPANDVYIINDITGNELLIPAVKDYIESFDSFNKVLTLKPGSEDIYDQDSGINDTSSESDDEN